MNEAYKFNYYKEGDPRIRVTEDRWGDKVTVVGRATKHRFTIGVGKMRSFGGEIVVVRSRDRAVLGLHPNSVK